MATPFTPFMGFRATTALDNLRGEHAAATKDLAGDKRKEERERKLAQEKVAGLQEAHSVQAAKSLREWQVRQLRHIHIDLGPFPRKKTSLSLFSPLAAPPHPRPCACALLVSGAVSARCLCCVCDVTVLCLCCVCAVSVLVLYPALRACWVLIGALAIRCWGHVRITGLIHPGQAGRRGQRRAVWMGEQVRRARGRVRRARAPV